MVTYLFAIVFIVLAVFFIRRLFVIASRFNPVEEPPEEVGDINVREPVPRRPLSRSGAVAMEEPEDDIDTDACAGR
jgi:hypothetical protein